MPRKKQTFKVVGEAPITVGSNTYAKGDEFEATKEEVSFLLEIGSVKPKS